MINFSENNIIDNFEYKCKPQEIIETKTKNGKKALHTVKRKALNALIMANFQCEADCGNKLFILVLSKILLQNIKLGFESHEYCHKRIVVFYYII